MENILFYLSLGTLKQYVTLFWLYLDPPLPHVTFSDTVATPPPFKCQVSRIIWNFEYDFQK